jgi:hypothetical protein
MLLDDLYAEQGTKDWAKEQLRLSMEARGLKYEDPDLTRADELAGQGGYTIDPRERDG